MQDRRSEIRLLCADMVDVTWQDGRGRTRQATALLEDISTAGACIQFEAPLPLGTELQVACPQGSLEGVVRYCVYREVGYFVGIEFAGDCRWRRDQFEPRHLLDLEGLIKTRRGGDQPN